MLFIKNDLKLKEISVIIKEQDMKKFLLFCVVFLALTQTSKATEISNPFYLPPKETISLSTTISYQKFHVQKLINGYQDYRTRNRFIEENFMYGVAPKVSILASISNKWERKNFDNSTLTDKTDSNVNWNLGALYELYNKNDIKFHLKLRYLQKETHHFGGAYKAFNINAKTGYLTKYLLPYIGAEIELPIAQKKTADNNEKYDIFAGFYKNFSDIIAFDGIVHYNYDKLYKSKKLNGKAVLSLYITEKLALSGFFDYTFFDRGKNNADANSHTIGTSIQLEF